jgi:hypothetical protein
MLELACINVLEDQVQTTDSWQVAMTARFVDRCTDMTRKQEERKKGKCMIIEHEEDLRCQIDKAQNRQTSSPQKNPTPAATSHSSKMLSNSSPDLANISLLEEHIERAETSFAKGLPFVRAMSCQGI